MEKSILSLNITILMLDLRVVIERLKKLETTVESANSIISLRSPATGVRPPSLPRYQNRAGVQADIQSRNFSIFFYSFCHKLT